MRRRRWLPIFLLLGTAFASAAPPPASGFEFLDGRLQVHGFYENQIRFLGRDLDPSDDIDLAQWYHVLNVEVEYEVAPDGWGPFDLISTFARLEGRYDCVWQRACGMLRADDQPYGDDARHLPKRVSDARRPGLTGVLPTGDLRRRHVVPRSLTIDLDPDDPSVGPVTVPALDFPFKDIPVPNRRRPAFWFNTPVLDDLFNNPGVDGKFGVADGPGLVGTDPAPFYFSPVLDGCKYSFRGVAGPENGIGTQPGVWNPGCKIRTLGRLADKPNPFAASDFSPITGDFGSTELPTRPAPLFRASDGVRLVEGVPDPTLPGASNVDARGVYYPNAAIQRLEREFDNFDQNFRQSELEWNHGASQQDEKELKELYVDLEALDSRLWVRAGKQSIVWGKTELFRTTDQFNPQDIALATLSDLEESRISLWSVRGVWSFWEVGPLQDVRLELAVNLDQFEPVDLGRCGEPFTPNPVCTKTFGLLLHGVFAEGLAGEIRPPDPWNDSRGLEFGARLEWRWGRFSFQLADFYGFDDFPFLDIAFAYERNVDPLTGRPRTAGSREDCDIDGTTTGSTAGCLGLVSEALASPAGNPFTDPNADGDPDRVAGELVIRDAVREITLNQHSTNLQLFAAICSTSIGFSDLDFTVCAQSILNSKGGPLAGGFATLSQLLSAITSGSAIAVATSEGVVTPGVQPPLVDLNRDVRDDTPGSGTNRIGSLIFNNDGLALRLTPEQEALLGCGPFFGTHCDDDGIDLTNAEASAIVQSWPGYEGTSGAWRMDFGDVGLDLDGDGIPDPQAMPGTVSPGPDGMIGTPDDVAFRGGSPCLRFEDGVTYILPGCRGPDYDAATLAAPGFPVIGAYDPNVDGCVRALTAAEKAAGLDPTGLCDGQPTLAIPDELVTTTVGTVVEPFGHSTGYVFQSEMAAWSWNAMMGLGVGISTPTDFNQDGTEQDEEFTVDDFDERNPLGFNPGPNGILGDFDDPTEPGADGVPGTADDPLDPNGDPLPLADRCGYIRPQLCNVFQSLLLITGQQRASVRAGGNGEFGRTDFLWHGGTSAVLRYQKRNVLGFSMDFAEDRTKSNWSIEAAWIEGLPSRDHDEFDNITVVDTYNLTISADRPTFINFLNPGRTFFFNTQWFFQYVDGYTNGFQSNGPFNMLFTFTANTGYFDDRLQPQMTVVYDFRSNSGGWLPRVTYRFTSNFSGTVGANFFWGRFETKRAALTQTVLAKRAGIGADNDYVENALSAVRDRDEVYLRIRYTF